MALKINREKVINRYIRYLLTGGIVEAAFQDASHEKIPAWDLAVRIRCLAVHPRTVLPSFRVGPCAGPDVDVPFAAFTTRRLYRTILIAGI
jgi:hypothetical protein